MVANAPTDLLSEDDLELAWRRVRADQNQERQFVTHPFLESWIEADRGRWLRQLRERVRAGYSPHDCVPCYEPKGNWMVRPGAVLDVEDEVVYSAILGRFHDRIWTALRWSQGTTDINYQLRAPGSVDWVQSGFRVWRQWRQLSLAHLQPDRTHVLITDIAGFYENIDLSLLYSRLNTLGLNHDLLRLLFNCLRRWAPLSVKGIPQGYTASDILAKVFLEPIDRALHNDGYVHLRYVDDIRVFCRSELEARRVLFRLTVLLGSCGLNLQSEKTRIVPAPGARRDIDGVTPAIERIQGKLRKELQDNAAVSDYVTVDEFARAVASDPENPAPEVMERAFREAFLAEHPKFDKTLFHYLLTRLGRIRSRVAVSYCLGLLRERPEETRFMLRYMGEVFDPADRAPVLEFLAGDDAIYDQQIFRVVRWFFLRGDFPPELVALCRVWAFDRGRDPWLRSYSLAVLGRVADPADLDSILSSYARAQSDLERADVVQALAFLEPGRRNAFFGRISRDGELVTRAIGVVRAAAVTHPEAGP